MRRIFRVKSREVRQLLKNSKKFVDLYTQQEATNSSPDRRSLLGDVVFHDEDTVRKVFFRSSLQTSKKLHKLKYNVANKVFKLCSFCADSGQNLFRLIILYQTTYQYIWKQKLKSLNHSYYTTSILFMYGVYWHAFYMCAYYNWKTIEINVMICWPVVIVAMATQSKTIPRRYNLDSPYNICVSSKIHLIYSVPKLWIECFFKRWIKVTCSFGKFQQIAASFIELAQLAWLHCYFLKLSVYPSKIVILYLCDIVISLLTTQNCWHKTHV